jgi:hypothetical protein
MNKFLDWFYKNRKTIGYTIGGLNLLSAVNYAVNGDYGLAVLWTVIGAFLVIDAHEFK